MRKCSRCVSADRKRYRENPKNKDAILRRQRRHRERLKREVVDAYGGACACCGESDIVFLAVDHINGNMGGKNRPRSEMGAKLYARLRRAGFPQGEYRILCHNCNFAEHVLGIDQCPHAVGR